MAEIRLDTIGDLGDVHVIYACCRSCRRDARLSPPRLAAGYGAAVTIAELKNRLTCSRCRQRGCEIRLVYSLPARWDWPHERPGDRFRVSHSLRCLP